MKSVEQNPDDGVNNDEKNKSSEGLPIVDSVVPNVEEHMEQFDSNSDKEELPSESLEILKVSEVDLEPSSDSVNGNDIDEESNPSVELPEVV
uniref:Ovule protein n=1 Tax=Strongyloides venezuelensis TaxID=75913 RepID=A0A0K0FPA2_STRVS